MRLLQGTTRGDNGNLALAETSNPSSLSSSLSRAEDLAFSIFNQLPTDLQSMLGVRDKPGEF